MNSILTDNVTVRNGKLYFGEKDVTELAQKYGTPLYIMDEQRIRRNCREYKQARRILFKRRNGGIRQQGGKLQKNL